MFLRLAALLFILLASACSLNKPSNETPYIKQGLQQAEQSQGELKRRVLLLGDAGHSAIDPLQASLQKAVERANQAPGKTTVVMLGDNIYYYGFPNMEEGQLQYNKSQLEDISNLEAQLQIAKLSDTEMFIVPGNHDWYAEQVDSQAQYIEDYAKENTISAEFTPHQLNADPLPEIIHRDGISIVFVDTMWMIKAKDKPFQNAMQHLDSLLQDTAQQHPDNIILVTAHHPIETMGAHNRYYTSFGYRTFIAAIELFMENDQDTDHPRYQRLIEAMEQTLDNHQKVVYAAGHDHNLQVCKDSSGKAPQYRLVSGAANTSKITGVGSNENTEFALAQEGLMEMDILNV